MSCIVVFGRQPVPGRVKTRLASAIGADAAAEIYAALLNHTLAVAAATGEEVVLSLAEEVRDGWRPPPGVRVELQGEGGLGDRMAESFTRRFAEGWGRVVIIGSDCAELAVERLSRALDLPGGAPGGAGACDRWRLLGGGTATSGCARCSSRSRGRRPKTLDRTRRVLQSLGVGWHELDTLSDLDTAADLDRDLTSAGVLPVLADRLRRAVSSGPSPGRRHDRGGRRKSCIAAAVGPVAAVGGAAHGPPDPGLDRRRPAARGAGGAQDLPAVRGSESAQAGHHRGPTRAAATAPESGVAARGARGRATPDGGDGVRSGGRPGQGRRLRKRPATGPGGGVDRAGRFACSPFSTSSI